MNAQHTIRKALWFLAAIWMLGAPDSPAAERLYEGKPASYWMDALRDPKAASALAQALKDEDRGVRFGAAKALAAMLAQPALRPADPAPVVTALTGALEDEDKVVRRTAAMGLGEAGARAKAAIPALRRRLEDTDEQVRAAAAEALKRVEVEAQ